MPKSVRPRCKQCKRVGEVEELQTWGRRRNGWLKQLCPECDAARVAKRTCSRCGVSASDRPDWGRVDSGPLKTLCPDCDAAWQAKLAAYACQRCGITLGQRPDWGRYDNGRLKNLCPCCDAREAKRRGRNEAARAAGYKSFTQTPEARRLQREREAAREGRSIEPYLPQAERERIGRMVDADRLADRVRAQWISDWLRPFQKSDTEMYHTDAEYREHKQAAYRARYARTLDFERARSRAWRTAHPQARSAQQARRNRRVLDGSDGTATVEAIARLKDVTGVCAYCGCELTEKQTDHMNPLVLGGEHSLRNIVIVCPSCNGKKGKLSYAEWVDRVAPEHRARVLRLYLDRYGDVAA